KKTTVKSKSALLRFTMLEKKFFAKIQLYSSYTPFYTNFYTKNHESMFSTLFRELYAIYTSKNKNLKKKIKRTKFITKLKNNKTCKNQKTKKQKRRPENSTR